MKLTMDEWIIWGKQRKLQLYFYQEKVLQLNAFSLVHPVGKKALRNYTYKDITQVLFSIYPHSPQILKKLDRYNIGVNLSYKLRSEQKERSKSHKKLKEHKINRKVCFGENIYFDEETKENSSSWLKKGGYQNHKTSSDGKLKQSRSSGSSSKSKMSQQYIQITFKAIAGHFNDTRTGSEDCISILEHANQADSDLEESKEGQSVMKIPYFKAKAMGQI